MCVWKKLAFLCMNLASNTLYVPRGGKDLLIFPTSEITSIWYTTCKKYINTCRATCIRGIIHHYVITYHSLAQLSIVINPQYLYHPVKRQ